MNILFICKYNRFRSRVAEAYFKKINKNKSLSVKSAGIIKGSYPLDKTEVEVSKREGLNIQGEPQGLSTDILKWQDITVIVANDVPIEIMSDNSRYGKKTIKWKIKDWNEGSERIIEEIIKQIKSKVDEFVKNLEKEK